MESVIDGKSSHDSTQARCYSSSPIGVNSPLLSFGDGLIGQYAVVRVDALGDSGVRLDRRDCSHVRKLADIRQRRIRERERAGVRHCGRHVGDAIMHNAVDLVAGVGVRRRASGFDASALVDGNVDDDRAFFILATIALVTILGAAAPGMRTPPITRSASSETARSTL